MNHPFVISSLAFLWVGINAVGLAVLVIWGWRYHFAYRGSQPAGEGNPETMELKQVLVPEDRAPFSFRGGISRRHFQLSMLVYFVAGFALVAFFFQWVPGGMTLGQYLRSSSGFIVKLVWVFLLLALHAFHWAAVIKRLRATTKNPWGLVLCAPFLPLYLIQLIALGQGSDGVLVKERQEA